MMKAMYITLAVYTDDHAIFYGVADSSPPRRYFEMKAMNASCGSMLYASECLVRVEIKK